MIIVYGIPNCDNVRKARTWLGEQRLAFGFHDFKKLGLPPDVVVRWVQAVGWDTLLNRKGTTWRQLDTGLKLAVIDGPSAVALMLAHPTLVKRPVMDAGGAISVGFEPARWQAAIDDFLGLHALQSAR